MGANDSPHSEERINKQEESKTYSPEFDNLIPTQRFEIVVVLVVLGICWGSWVIVVIVATDLLPCEVKHPKTKKTDVWN